MSRIIYLLLLALLVGGTNTTLKAQELDEEELEEESTDFEVTNPFFHFTIIGKILNEEVQTRETAILVYKVNREISHSDITFNGKFELILQTGRTYTLEVNSPGFFVQRIAINTEIIQDVPYVPPFEFNLNLIAKTPELLQDSTLNRDLIDFPVALISYSEEEEQFWFDESYSKAVKKEREAAGLK